MCKDIPLHLAYLVAFGSIWKIECSCLELLRCLGMTSKQFYISLMKDLKLKCLAWHSFTIFIMPRYYPVQNEAVNQYLKA